MRTTLDIEADVLQAAKDLARQRGVSIGRVISDLARQSLTPPVPGQLRNGIPIFPVQPGAQIVTAELINQLRDELP